MAIFARTSHSNAFQAAFGTNLAGKKRAALALPEEKVDLRSSASFATNCEHQTGCNYSNTHSPEHTALLPVT
jgi:hypothetical protein